MSIEENEHKACADADTVSDSENSSAGRQPDRPDSDVESNIGSGQASPDEEKAGESESGPKDDESRLNEPVLDEQLATLGQQLKEAQDGYLRAKADVENIRRRSQNEIVSARKYAIEGFAQELLSVKDSLDQASKVDLENAGDEAMEKMQEGLALTLKQLDSTFGRFSVTEVEAGPGVKFNPDFHQAISMVPGGEIEPDHIVDVMQKGFVLKDRLLRPAMVVVAKSE